MSILEIKNLCISIGSRRIVEDVSLTIGRGERVGLIGESGSGKSLTCMAVLGLLPPRGSMTGSIIVDGEQLVGASKQKLQSIRGAKVGCVFQEPQSALDPLMPIHRHLVSGLRAHGLLKGRKAMDIAIELAESVGLPDPASIVKRYPHELSGGQRQRVMIAMAMSTNPVLLLADEPTTALDVTVQAHVLDLMSNLVTESGMGNLLVTHDMAVAATRCDRIAVLQKGRIVEEGTPDELIDNPRHEYTAKLIDAAYATSWQPESAPEAAL